MFSKHIIALKYDPAKIKNMTAYKYLPQDPETETKYIVGLIREYRTFRRNPINILVVGNVGAGKTSCCKRIQNILKDIIPPESIHDSDPQCDDDIIKLISTTKAEAIIWIINVTDELALTNFLTEFGPTYKSLSPTVKGKLWFMWSHTDSLSNELQDFLKIIVDKHPSSRLVYTPLIIKNDMLANFNILKVIKDIYHHVSFCSKHK